MYLAELGHKVTMVDFSVEGLRKAERLARERGVQLNLIHSDLAVFVPDGIFTGVISIFAHIPRAARRRMHARLSQILAPEGVFLLEAYNHRQPSFGTGGPRDPERLMSLEELRLEVSPLRVILGREVERDVREGIYHTGRGATVQIIAAH